MKHLSFILLVSCFVCCGGNVKQEVNNEVVTPVVKETPKTRPATNVVSSTNDQQVSAENAVFPFDIQLKDVNGKVKSSADIFKQNGKPTVLMFWLTTCGPCHRKLNAIQPLYPEWKKNADFNVYAISGDYAKNYDNFVKQTKSKNWEWETYNDVDRKFRTVLPGRLNGYPQTFIFDKDGKLVYQDRKYRNGDEKKLFNKIKEICNS